MKVPEKYRVKNGFYGSSEKDGNNGVFIIKKNDHVLRVIASDSMGWDHVSVSLASRCPTWEEMCFVKDLFFDDDEMVIQYHMPACKHINIHPYCLHLWKPNDGRFIPTPPSIMVGVK